MNSLFFFVGKNNPYYTRLDIRQLLFSKKKKIDITELYDVKRRTSSRKYCVKFI